MSEQFENSIRKKLQDADIPFEPAAWDQMKKRLDDSGRRRPFFWWWAGALLVFLGLGAGGWWWFASDSRIPVSDSSITDVNVDKAVGQTPTPASGSGSQENISKPTNIAPTDNSGKVNDVVGKTGIVVNNMIGNKENHSSNAPAINKPLRTSHGNRYTVDNVSQNVSQRAKPVISDSSVNKVVQNRPSQNSSQPSVEKKEKVDKPVANSMPVLSDKHEEENKPVAAKSVADSSKTNIATDQPRVKKTGKRKFDAGITLGPDYNTVASLKHGRVGFGGGLLLRYHINSNFYLSTGAAYTKKLYGADDKDYYSNYPTNYKKIDADCKVLDVPLNMHYTFLHRPKHSWSVMAGASSYFMLKEEYEYYNYNGGRYKREYNNKSQHYFSVVNLAFGYERETKGIIKWDVQPYLKLPLGGVGAGKVNLYSAGISLQVTVGKKD